eukprot:8785991-Alexandrium_andersonii.AAC.1
MPPRARSRSMAASARRVAVLPPLLAAVPLPQRQWPYLPFQAGLHMTASDRSILRGCLPDGVAPAESALERV